MYVTSFPTAGGKVRVSVNGGVQPRWNKDGKELFYLSSDRKVMAVPIRASSTFEVGAPKALFDLRFNPRGSQNPYAYFQYDVSADEQRFLVNTPLQSATVPITVVLNWAAALNK